MRTVLSIAAVLLASALSAACSSESRPAAGEEAGSNATAQANVGASATGGVADPAAWVRESYDPAGRAAFDAVAQQEAGAAADEAASGARYSARPEFSPRLRALFADDETYADGEIGRLDFNPFSGASDDDVQRADVTSQDVDGAPDRKVVIARFRNMDVDQTIIYFWERIGGLWYIDDIAGRTAGEPSGWTLSLILKYGHSAI